MGCPPDVSAVVVGDLSCGYLTVLEDRADPSGSTVRMFVARVVPDGEVAPDPYVLVGGDLADLTNYGGFAPTAQRTGRELFMIDPRGVGHSEPNLACPEVDELTVDVFEAPMDDPAARASFLDAVGACYDRVTGGGADPSMYSLDSVAADVVDLRTTLGIDEWNVATHGTASRISFEIARLDPEGVRALFLDTPDVSEVDPFTEAIVGTPAALDDLARACAEDTTCAAAFPDLRASIHEALARLEESPITVSVPADAAANAPADVVVDDVRFVALLRQILSDGASSGGPFDVGAVPAAVAAALRGRFDASPGSLIANSLDDQPYCTGFLPKCTMLHRVSYGALLSYLCRDVVPFLDRDQLVAVAKHPSYAAAFAESPFIEACERWPVTPASEPPAPIPTDVPALVELGHLDPYGHPEVVGDALSTLETVTIAEGPLMSHNISPVPCFIDLRRAWLEDPAARVPGADCGKDIPIVWVLR